MILDLLLASASLAAWAGTARYLFRRWVRNETFKEADERCSHGFLSMHSGESCHGRHPLAHIYVAIAAAGAALAFPVTLFLLFVMTNPPMGRAALERNIRELEAENKKLRKETE